MHRSPKKIIKILTRQVYLLSSLTKESKAYMKIKKILIFVSVGTAIAATGAFCVSMFNTDDVNYIPDYFISLFSSILGGLCTLIGVLLTLSYNKNFQINKGKPIIFVPGRFDFADALTIKCTCDSEPSITIPNYKIVLKNSDKAAFTIEKIKVEDTEFKPQTISYIGKDELFCISFFCQKKVVLLQLFIQSMDDRPYMYQILLKDNVVFLKEEKCHDDCNKNN